MDTDQDYSPHSLLPASEPRTVDYELGYFYNNVAKHLIKDTVRLMNNGLHIDLDKVEELEKVLDEQLKTVEVELANNPLISTFQKLQHKKHTKDYISNRKSKMRSSDYYLKPFNHKNMVHRSYFMDLYATQYNLPIPEEKLSGSSIGKWPIKLVKAYAKTRPILQRLLNGELTTHPLIDKAMNLLASDKANIYNEKYLQQIKNPEIPLPKFNPASSKQKQELFAWLDIKAEKFSKDTGLPSFDRSEVERINKETLDPDVKHFTQCFIDHSFAAIVRNNFIEAFYRYTVNDRLYGQYKLLGAKTGRYTSSNPNMLNSPSTGSVFAKPIKQCFTAPEGFLIATADYSALEDRVMASLSRDANKCGLFLENLDGHSLSATYYYPDRVKELIGDFIDNKEASKLLKQLVDDGNKTAKDIRQDAKPISFGLAYGAFPKKVAATVKISLVAAESIFNAYHNELYPGITKYREEYVLPVTKEKGKIHLGLGFYLNSDDPGRDIRTLNNATCQFWSILTALTINKMHRLIDKANLQNDIIVTSTIYDSIYFEVRNDPIIIKWLNDNLIPIMLTDFMENQTIKNEANLEIGTSWADLYELSNNANLEDINSVLKDINGN
ncbi:MAG: DNA polymerase [Ignavibacteria bacterium]|jgi:hypothetical protein